MIRGIHHIGLSVSDIDRSAALFGAGVPLEQVAAFTLKDDAQTRAVTGLPEAAAQVAMFRAPNAYLELFQFSKPHPGLAAARPVSDAGITHVCIQAREAARVRGAMETAGARFFSPHVDLSTGFLYAYASDNDENVIESEGAPFAPEEPQAWLGHIAFATHDIARLANFYADLSGTTVVRGPRIANNALVDQVTGLNATDVRAAWVRASNLTLEFWQYYHPATVARGGLRAVSDLGYSHVCFEVDDVDAAAARAVELGATLHCAPVDTPMARLVYARDPDGNVIEFVNWSARAVHLSLDRLSDPDILARVAQAHSEAQQRAGSAA